MNTKAKLTIGAFLLIVAYESRGTPLILLAESPSLLLAVLVNGLIAAVGVMLVYEAVLAGRK